MHVATAAFRVTTDQLSGAVSSPFARPLVAWMPLKSLHGRTHGVFRKW